jgi:hypothetical protein
VTPARPLWRRLLWGPRRARVYHWPGDQLCKVPVRERRSAAAWTFIVATILFVFLRNSVAYVSALSVVALLGIVTGETPVEEEAA